MAYAARTRPRNTLNEYVIKNPSRTPPTNTITVKNIGPGNLIRLWGEENLKGESEMKTVKASCKCGCGWEGTSKDIISISGNDEYKFCPTCKDQIMIYNPACANEITIRPGHPIICSGSFIYFFVRFLEDGHVAVHRSQQCAMAGHWTGNFGDFRLLKNYDYSAPI